MLVNSLTQRLVATYKHKLTIRARKKEEWNGHGNYLHMYNEWLFSFRIRCISSYFCNIRVLIFSLGLSPKKIKNPFTLVVVFFFLAFNFFKIWNPIIHMYGRGISFIIRWMPIKYDPIVMMDLDNLRISNFLFFFSNLLWGSSRLYLSPRSSPECNFWN